VTEWGDEDRARIQREHPGSIRHLPGGSANPQGCLRTVAWCAAFVAAVVGAYLLVGGA
jgi:hypothetical protein